MMNGYDFILASGSPRREELLEISGWKVLLHPVIIDEVPSAGEAPTTFAKRLALEKAEKARNADNLLILAADTIVIHENHILGKPQNKEDATRMLQELQNKFHQVVTAIALVDPVSNQTLVDCCETSVPMRAYEGVEIEAYITSGSPLDKAGAYGIQDEAFHPVDVESMVGCYANVMGLPLCHLKRAMEAFGGMTPADVPEKCMAYTSYNCQVYGDILRQKL